MILDSNLNISNELITMLAEKSNQYYTLLNAHNKNTEDMKKNHIVSYQLCSNIIIIKINKSFMFN